MFVRLQVTGCAYVVCRLPAPICDPMLIRAATFVFINLHIANRSPVELATSIATFCFFNNGLVYSLKIQDEEKRLIKCLDNIFCLKY